MRSLILEFSFRCQQRVTRSLILEFSFRCQQRVTRSLILGFSFRCQQRVTRSLILGFIFRCQQRVMRSLILGLLDAYRRIFLLQKSSVKEKGTWLRRKVYQDIYVKLNGTNCGDIHVKRDTKL
jgi:hypothetical protein